MSENGEIYTAGINFTLLPAVTTETVVTKLTSACTTNKTVFLCCAIFVQILQLLRTLVACRVAEVAAIS